MMAPEFENPTLLMDYERLRADGPVSWSEQNRAWMVTGYDEADIVLRDADLFGTHAQRDRLTPERWDLLAATFGGERALVLLPEPLHSRLVTQIRRRLTSLLPSYLPTRVIPVIDHFLDPYLAAGGGEFRSEVGAIIPTAVICSVLGLPWDDRAQLLQWKEWDAVVVTLSSRMDVAEADTGRRAAAEVAAALMPVILDRREHPQDDFISVLWEIVPSVIPDCTPEDIAAQCRQLFLGGSHSTTFALSNAVALLFSRPDLLEELRENREQVDVFIDETLRVLGVLEQRPRVVITDTELGGAQLRAGDAVYVLLQAANRDPLWIPDPLTASLAPDHQKRHLAFGSGRKMCAGMALAKAEVRHVIGRMLDDADNPRIDTSRGEPVFVSESTATCWSPLHLAFDPARGRELVS